MSSRPCERARARQCLVRVRAAVRCMPQALEQKLQSAETLPHFLERVGLERFGERLGELRSGPSTTCRDAQRMRATRHAVYTHVPAMRLCCSASRHVRPHCIRGAERTVAFRSEPNHLAAQAASHSWE